MGANWVLAALIAAGTIGHAAAADFWTEPALMASISVPLDGSPGNRASAASYSLAVSRRGIDADTEDARLLELSAPLSSPTSFSLNGVPVSRSVGRASAGPADTELTTEEKFASVAIVGLAIAGAAGVVIVVND